MRDTGLAFLRWMCRYLMNVAGKLDFTDEVVKHAYQEYAALYRDSYKQIKNTYGVDLKNRILRVLFQIKH